MTSVYSGKYRGDSCGLLEPPPETKLFHFHVNFPEKISINYQIIIRYNFQIEPHFVNVNPLARNPGSDHASRSTIYFILFTWASTYEAHMEPGVSWWLSGSSSRCHGVVCRL